MQVVLDDGDTINNWRIGFRWFFFHVDIITSIVQGSNDTIRTIENVGVGVTYLTPFTCEVYGLTERQPVVGSTL